MDPLNVLRDIVEENLDRLIVARLEEDLELVSGCDPVLEAALQRVIKFLDVSAKPLTSPEVADPAISAIQSLLDSIYESYLDSSEIAVALENIIKEHNATKD